MNKSSLAPIFVAIVVVRSVLIVYTSILCWPIENETEKEKSKYNNNSHAVNMFYWYAHQMAQSLLNIEAIA